MGRIHLNERTGEREDVQQVLINLQFINLPFQFNFVFMAKAGWEVCK